MRASPLIHITGPDGVGKTTFIERLLGVEVALVACVRAERDLKLRTERESAPRTHAELRRYRKAGASGIALYHFPEPDPDAFFMSAIMEDYSEVVFIEGDCPVDYVDLAVFVAPVPAKGRALLRRVMRDHTAAHQASITQLSEALENPEALARLIGVGLGESFTDMVLKRPRVLDDLRRPLSVKLSELRRAPAPAPTEHWTLEECYQGIERAQLVVVNIRAEQERLAAEEVLIELERLRKDEAVFRDVVGFRGDRTPISAVVAELSNPKDAGFKKALARVKRVTKSKKQ